MKMIQKLTEQLDTIYAIMARYGEKAKYFQRINRIEYAIMRLIQRQTK